jgi:iron complex outermembrane receptor protein
VHSVFLFEEARIDEQWRVQLGARYDRQTNDSDTAPGFTGLEREFDAFSGSLGAVFTPDDTWAAALTASYTRRPPTYVELFADGPHVATDAFELGDADLGLEESFALDLTVRKKLGRVTGAASVFFYHFKDFIALSPTGAESEAEEDEEGLPIFAYRATDANFVGGEIEATWHLLQPIEDKDAAATPHTLDLTGRADYVFVEDTASDRSLPRITPFRAAAELAYSWRDRFNARVEGQFVARQSRTAEFELPTDSYFLLNASVSYRVPIGATHCDFYVRGSNLTDGEARLHTSFLKEVAPLPGRSVLAGVRFEF